MNEKGALILLDDRMVDRLAGSQLPKVTLPPISKTDVNAGRGYEELNLSNELLIRIFIMQSNGTTPKDIAKVLDLKDYHITSIISSPDFEAIRKILTKDLVSLARDRLTVATNKAVDTLIRLMDSGDEKIQLRASTEILNRVGVIIPQKIEIEARQTVVHEMDNAQLEAIIKAGGLALQQGSEIVEDKTKVLDAEYSEVKNE